MGKIKQFLLFIEERDAALAALFIFTIEQFTTFFVN